MVSAMSYPRNPLWYDLCCIIWGDSSIHSFSVRVCKDSTISELKDMVKKSKLSLSLVHSDEIRLWKVDICLEDEKLLQQYCYAKEHDQGKKMLSSTNSVNDYWSEQPKDCHIQLIVEPTLIGRPCMDLPKEVLFEQSQNEFSENEKNNGGHDVDGLLSITINGHIPRRDLPLQRS
ncbi:15944_t:CDS:2 [Rhizophagus irregularis]|nr:15944_t:CDS:2 [Rhizophagus irregularis]